MKISLRKDEGKERNHLWIWDQVSGNYVFCYLIPFLVDEVVERFLAKYGVVYLLWHTFQVIILEIIDEFQTCGEHLCFMP